MTLDEVGKGLKDQILLREQFEARLLEQFGTLDVSLGEEKVSREQAERRAAEERQELAQALAQLREALATETGARRDEISAVSMTLDEVGKGVKDQILLREQFEARLLEQFGTLDVSLGEEKVSRELAERLAAEER